MTGSNTPVVVGISRRTGSPQALAFAVDEARMRGTTVLAVTAWRPPRPPGAPSDRPVGFPQITPGDVWAQEVRRIGDRLDGHLGADAADAGVTFELRRGAPGPVLLEAARGAQLLVLDSPRAGNITTMAKTWIAPTIVLRAPCPVVVMPPGGSGTGLRARLLGSAGTAGRPGLRLS